VINKDQVKGNVKAALCIATLAIALGLGACQKKETPAESQADVAAASSEASEDIAEARKDANADVADASRTQATAQTEVSHEVSKADEAVALAEANGVHKVAIEKCEAMTGDARASCKRQADADLEMAKARAHQGRAATDPKP
jgi:hypothetical protein